VNPNQQVPTGAVLLSFAILFVLFLLARWVYRDALQNGFSRGSAFLWGALTFFAWIALFLYLVVKAMRKRTRV
jgi:hypothetical protein